MLRFCIKSWQANKAAVVSFNITDAATAASADCLYGTTCIGGPCRAADKPAFCPCHSIKSGNFAKRTELLNIHLVPVIRSSFSDSEVPLENLLLMHRGLTISSNMDHSVGSKTM